MTPRRVILILAAALVLTGGLLVGLGSGSASAGHAGAAKGTRTAAATTGSATVPEPVVTTVTQPTTPAQDLPGTNRPPVRLGDMNTPEQFIIGQLYEVALAQQGYTVILSRNLGPPSLRAEALQYRTLDIYPEYLGEWNSQVAHLRGRFGSLHASLAAAADYAHRHGFVLLPPTPFSDTSCVAVQTQYAQENDIYSLPQLAHQGPIIFGAPSIFADDADGVPAIEHVYHLTSDYVQAIGDGLQYWWLRTGNVDAAYCSTTDPALAGQNFVELRDPRNIFGYGNVIPVTTQHVLQVEGKPFKQTIERVDSLLTQRAIRGLNSEMEQGGHGPTEIAQQFLQGYGILPAAKYAPVPTTTSTTPTATGT